MQFAIGDLVLFKQDSLQAEIIKINSIYKVTVLTIDGFEMNVSIKDLVKIEKGTDTPASYGDDFSSKDNDDLELSKSQKKQKNQMVLKIDLHIELLTSNYQNMDNFDIMQIQLNECYKMIEKALKSNIYKLEIIHGIGEGVLRSEVHTILRKYDLRFYLTKDDGCTEVYI